ncbi:MAG: 2-amino-4-hydroxy-6-hydroxymethyldihydropteridine diphosphokinase [Candidatus Omnitrophica bacterium]|nr:2-amino-4-hydroxy-6-hydroxymethyldihydropteridine diphosphokinase [Candidatus Omnitrophota bacterium]
MARIFLSLGSNVGNRAETVRKAVIAISQLTRCVLIKESPLYETKPVAGPLQEDFLNQVIEICCDVAPLSLLDSFQSIEKSLGRLRAERFGPRAIDIDILFYDNLILHDTYLTVPHPRLTDRLFVLCPFSDIAHDFIHPVRKKTIGTLMHELKERVGGDQKVLRIEG